MIGAVNWSAAICDIGGDWFYAFSPSNHPFYDRRVCNWLHGTNVRDTFAMETLTRSQAVARIADRTASQHLWRSRDVMVTWPFDSPCVISYWWSFGTKSVSLSLTVSEIFNVECNAMVDVTLMRPLNKDQGHSFWYQPISHIRFPIGCQ